MTPTTPVTRRAALWGTATVLVSTLWGCASSPSTSASATPLASPATPPATAPLVADQSRVYVYRRSRFFAGGSTFEVETNATPAGKLTNGTYLVLDVPPGNHTFTVKPGAWGGSFHRPLQTTAGQTYYIEFDLNGGLLANAFFTGSELVQRSAEHALSDLKNLSAAR